MWRLQKLRESALMQGSLLTGCKAVGSWAAKNTSFSLAFGSEHSTSSRFSFVWIARDCDCRFFPHEDRVLMIPPKTCSIRKVTSRPVARPKRASLSSVVEESGGAKRLSVFENQELREVARQAGDAQHSAARSSRADHTWIVYLMLSCDRKRTYVGVTRDLPHRYAPYASGARAPKS